MQIDRPVEDLPDALTEAEQRDHLDGHPTPAEYGRVLRFWRLEEWSAIDPVAFWAARTLRWYWTRKALRRRRGSR